MNRAGRQILKKRYRVASQTHTERICAAVSATPIGRNAPSVCALRIGRPTKNIGVCAKRIADGHCRMRFAHRQCILFSKGKIGTNTYKIVKRFIFAVVRYNGPFGIDKVILFECALGDIF